MNIQGLELLEMMESGFAAHEGNHNREGMCDCLKFHRFFVFIWLMQNGVSIPVELLNDNLHETALMKQIKGKA